MKIENARFISDNTIEAVVDGQTMFIPVAEANRHYRELVEQGITPTPFAAPPAPAPELTVDDILNGLRAEGILTMTPRAFKTKHAKRTTS